MVFDAIIGHELAGVFCQSGGRTNSRAKAHVRMCGASAWTTACCGYLARPASMRVGMPDGMDWALPIEEAPKTIRDIAENLGKHMEAALKTGLE